MMSILLTIHVIVTISLIGIILIQKGEGGGILGSGASHSMFTARGTANFFTHLTAILATLFIANAIAMTILTSHQIKRTQHIFDAPETIKK